MTKILMIAVILVWHCVVYGQLPFYNFGPYPQYYGPYTSTLIVQPKTQLNDGTETQSGGADELRDPPNMKTFSFQDTITFKINKLEATIASLASQLRATNANLAEKAAQKDLDTTNGQLQTTNTNLATKAAQTDLDKTKNDVSDLKVITSPKSIGSVPTSCGDLQTIGFVKSGIYSVMVNKQVKNVYCDFTASNNADLQKTIGTVDVKPTPTYFYAQMTSSYSTANTAVPFGSIKLNVGSAFTSSTGVFVAPTSGRYYFAYSGISDNSGNLRVVLQLKTATVDWTRVTEANTSGGFQACSLHSTLELLRGDQVRLFLTSGIIYENTQHIYTNYVGWLIEDEGLTV